MRCYAATVLWCLTRGMAPALQYAETLSKYHGFMVKKTFDVGLMAAPSTETMVKCLGPDQVRGAQCTSCVV